MRRSHLNLRNRRMHRKACRQAGMVTGSGPMASRVRRDSVVVEARAMGAGWGRRYSICSMRTTMA